MSEASTHIHNQSKTAWQQVNLLMETFNAADNYHLLNSMKEAGRVECLADCPRGDGKPALVIGSGSSLESVLPTISKWKGAVFCSTSHGTVLVKYGCKPTYMTAVDPRTAPDDQDEFGVPFGEWDDTQFVAHVSAPKLYFNRWFDRSKGMAYVYRILEPTYPWYTKHLPAMYPWVRVCLLPFIDSVASELQIAVRLGYNPIYMIGCDYGGPRFNLWQFIDGAWKFTDCSGGSAKEFNGPGGIGTSEMLMYSMRGTLISAFMAMMNDQRLTRIYQMSKPSNITELPFRNWESVLERQGVDEGSWKEGYRRHYTEQIEVRLAESDTYLLPTQGGYGTDYRVYMMVPPNFMRALADINFEILTNKVNFETMEERFLYIGYDGELQVILDKSANINALPLWLASPPGKVLTERARVEGKKLDIHKMNMREMFKHGLASVEKGEMIVHESEEMKDWDWRKMGLLDMEQTFNRLRRLKTASMALPGRTEYHAPPVIDGATTPEGIVAPHITEGTVPR
jgi:hypothetical protein